MKKKKKGVSVYTTAQSAPLRHQAPIRTKAYENAEEPLLSVGRRRILLLALPVWIHAAATRESV